jgi:hypothetical protein
MEVVRITLRGLNVNILNINPRAIGRIRVIATLRRRREEGCESARGLLGMMAFLLLSFFFLSEGGRRGWWWLLVFVSSR